MPVLTLTTDFGTQDGYVGAMKGTILSICPEVTLVDITHDISPQSVIQAAWCVARSVPQFPAGSIHTVVVDPGVGSSRNALLVQADSHWLVGPDNGVFSLLLERMPASKIIRIFSETEYWKAHASFDGLALFSPVAAHIAKGLAIEEIGEVVDDCEHLTFPQPQHNKEEIVGEILLFDRFGNAVTNIQDEQLRTWSEDMIRVQYQGMELLLNSHYQAGAEASAFALVNSDGLLELSVFRGSMQEAFRGKVGEPVIVRGGA